MAAFIVGANLARRGCIGSTTRDSDDGQQHGELNVRQLAQYGNASTVAHFGSQGSLQTDIRERALLDTHISTTVSPAACAPQVDFESASSKVVLWPLWAQILPNVFLRSS